MKVVHLINHCDLANGNVHVAIDLICEQVRQGHEPIVFSAGGYFTDLLGRMGVRHITLEQNVRRPWLFFAATWKLLRFFRREKPDLIHAHMMSGAVIGYFVSRIIGVPLVTTVHNSFDSHSKYMKLGDGVVTVSHAEETQLLQSGIRAAKVETVLNGPLGSPRYAVEPQRPATAAAPCIISLSGLHHRKGVGDILQAFASIMDDFPAWRLLIAGEGPDEKPLLDQSIALGIGDRVTFLGKVSEPFQVLSRAEIFVIASHAEPFGLATVEAMYAGCAAIGTDVGGIPEVLAYGEAGLIVPPRSPRALADALARLMGDPALLAEYQQRAQANLGRFTTLQMYAGYNAVYERLIGHRRQPV